MNTYYFLPYQRKWIMDASRLKILEKSRQIGMSFATAYRCVRKQLNENAHFDIWISSRDELQAKLFLEDCKHFAKLLHLAFKDCGLVVLDNENRSSAHVLEFENQRRIHSLSSNPNAQAGKRGSRILDEFALHPNQEELYQITYPGITWGGQLEIISTHRGCGNVFYQILDEIKNKGNPKGFSHHKITLENALDQGFLTKLKKKLPKEDPRHDMDEAAYFDFIKAGCYDEETFLQEYMCVPEKNEGAFLPWEMILACEYDISENWEVSAENLRDKELYMGIDIGRSHDKTVIWVLERISGKLLARRFIEISKERFSEQEQKVNHLLKSFKIRRVCIDKTGIGQQFCERLEEQFGKKCIEGIHFNSTSKETLAYALKNSFEDKAIRIPNQLALRKDLRSIRKIITPRGNLQFLAKQTQSGHADAFWALALAIHASQKNTSNYFLSIP